MSAPETAARAKHTPRAPLTFGTITVIGGGCYGTYYVRQLRRASVAGAVQWDHLVVVDRDPDCAVARAERAGGATSPPIELVVAEWGPYLTFVFDAACTTPDAFARDAVVPSPLMPHLTAEWLLHRAH